MMPSPAVKILTERAAEIARTHGPQEQAMLLQQLATEIEAEENALDLLAPRRKIEDTPIMDRKRILGPGDSGPTEGLTFEQALRADCVQLAGGDIQRAATIIDYVMTGKGVRE